MGESGMAITFQPPHQLFAFPFYPSTQHIPHFKTYPFWIFPPFPFLFLLNLIQYFHMAQAQIHYPNSYWAQRV